MLPSVAVAEEQGAPSKRSTEQLNRACEACRVSKVRCLPGPVPGSSQCQRCAKAGRQCIFAPPARRKQRKRTDVRVAELEREIKQLHSLLKPSAATPLSPVEASEHGSMEHDNETEGSSEKEPSDYLGVEEKVPGSATEQEFAAPKWPVTTPPAVTLPSTEEASSKPQDDIIDRGILTLSEAQEFLDIYRDDLVHGFPGIVIPKDWTVQHMRTQKPALFLSFMAAGSNSKGEALSERLHEELVQLFAQSIIIKAEKSIQHIQALYIAVAFCNPPRETMKLQIYLFSNMAASMALELGLVSKPRTHEQLPKRRIRVLQRIHSADELLENCRTILALYTMTAGISMRLRRPSILVFNNWMEECQVLLQKSGLLEDKRLLACLRLQRIADEAYTAFGLDDASTSFTLSELRLQATLRIFDRRMQDWKKTTPADVMTLTMTIEYHMNIITMWEFAMDGGRYDAPDFRNRHLTLPDLDDSSIQPESLLSHTALQINATITCISAAHAVLDTFLRFPVLALQRCTSIVYVRATVALIALLKADYAVGTDPEGMGAVLNSEGLGVERYLNEVLTKMELAVGEQRCRIPHHWLTVVERKLKSWHVEHMQWRKDGGHLRMRTANAEKKEGVGVGDIRRAKTEKPGIKHSHAQGPPATQHHTQPQQPPDAYPQPPQQQPLPSFTLPTDYEWPNTAIPTQLNQTPTAPISPAGPAFSNVPAPAANMDMSTAPYDLEMTDFSAAFQNGGDLYLWNDMSEAYGGWMPHVQGEGPVYDVGQFGGAGAGL